MENSSLGVTMETVARDAGVSRATVSRVLSGSTPVDETTRNKVLVSCRRLGYVRNEAATQLARRSSSLIGLLLRDARNPMYATLHELLLQAAWKRGLFVTTMSTGQLSEKKGEAIQLSRLMSLRPAGLFVASGVILAKDIIPYTSQVPTIILPRPESHPNLNVVGYDEVAHGRMLAQTVIAAGHKRVAVNVSPKFVSVAENTRTTTMVDTLIDGGVEVTRIRGKSLIKNHEAVFQRIYTGLKHKRFTAVMFPNDLKALEFMIRAQGAGLKVPGDIGVTGCDGLGLSVQISGLTTLKVPVEEVCLSAVNHMERMVEDGKRYREPIRELHEGTLVPGRTV